jgi:hypothetical protein
MFVGTRVGVSVDDTAGFDNSMVAGGVSELSLRCCPPELIVAVGVVNVTPLRHGTAGVGVDNTKDVTLITGVGKTSG